MLKVSPVICADNSQKLTIQYCLNPAEYPSGYHCHSDTITAKDIHIMLMGSFQNLGNESNFSLLGGALSLSDKGLQIIENDPTIEANHKVQLGIWKFWMDSPIRLVIFIDSAAEAI